MAFLGFAGPYAELSACERAAIHELVAPRYLELLYPTPAAIAEEFDVEPGTAAYQAKRAELVHRCSTGLAASYGDRDTVSALFAHTRRGVVAVATMQTIRGTGTAMVGETVGHEASTIPTHRKLRGFRYSGDCGLCACETPERALAEFTRLAVANWELLAPLVEDGLLTMQEAEYAVRHGLDEMVVRSVLRDWRLPQPPRAYILNTTPRLERVLRRKGLELRPLFLEGAEPTPVALDGPGAAYFRRWRAELAAVVPQEVLREGPAAALAHLAARGFTAWHRLAISLPYLLPNDIALARAVARLALACTGPVDDARGAQVAA